MDGQGSTGLKVQAIPNAQSVYGNYRSEPQYLSELKETYEISLGKDLTDPLERESLIRLARVISQELMPLPIPKASKIRMQSIIDDMAQSQRLQVNYDSMMAYAQARNAKLNAAAPDRSTFQDSAYDFLGSYNDALYKLGITHKMRRQISEFKKCYSILEAPNQWENDFGLPVSMEMEFLARMLIQRTYAKWDNIIFFEGKPGVGKSANAFSLATTMASLSKKHQFGMKNVFLKEPRDVVEDFIRTAPMYSIIVLDEAGNQLNSKLWYENEQIFFTNMLSLIRGLGHTILILWKEATSIDKSMRTNRAILLASTKKRGTLNLRTYNENPYATDSIYKPKYLKDKVILNAGKAAALQALDPTTLMQVPTYNLDKTEFWKEYWEKMKFPNMRMALSELLHTKPTEPQTIEYFLKTIKVEKIIDNKMMADFNAKYEVQLDLEKIASYLEFQMGLKAKAIYRGSTYLVLTPEIQGKVQEYINKLRGDAKT